MLSATDNRIRFVFDDSVICLGLPPNATYEDVARSWDEIALNHYTNPLAIDVRMARPDRSNVGAQPESLADV